MLVLLGSCRPANTGAVESRPVYPTPSLNPLFYSIPTVTIPRLGDLATPIPPPDGVEISPPANTPAGTPVDHPLGPTLTPVLSTPSPSQPPTATITPTFMPSPTPTIAYNIVKVFYDGLDDNWAIKYSTDVRYNEHDPAVSQNGQYSISIIPQADFGSLLLSIRQTSKVPYPRSDVKGVSFWLYSGDHEIKPTDLSVSIIGSNRFHFWFVGDRSVENDREPVFPEVPLKDLGITETIPAQTWVRVELLLDNLTGEPEYEYVTGIQIKNNAGFLSKFYVDQIELLLALTAP